MANSNVQEVRDRIIQLAREIEDYSKSDVPPRTFFNEFLRRIVGAVGARAGVVWMRNGSNRLEQFSEIGLGNTSFNENPEALTLNQKLLNEVISNGQACTYHPNETSEQLPTDDMLVLAALQHDKEVVGVVEVFQRADTPPQARPGFLQFVEQMTGYACRFLDRQKDKQLAETNVSVGSIAAEFEQFVLQLHKTLDVKEVAFTAANDGRLLVNCDRMSVAVLDGRKTVVRGISGQDKVNQRANLVRRMTTLASQVIKTKETMEYTGKVDHLAPKIEKSLADFIQESGSRMVTVIPVFEPEPLVEKEDDRSRPKEKNRKPVGGLIIEQVAESQPKPGVLDKAHLVADHVGSAIYNAKTYNRLFLMPVWRKLGKAVGFLEGRNAVKAAIAVLVLAAVVVAMIYVPWDYRVEGQGRMIPVVEKDVFAPWDGEVYELAVLPGTGKRIKTGDSVRGPMDANGDGDFDDEGDFAGDVLLRMRNPDLERQKTEAEGQRDSKAASYVGIRDLLGQSPDYEKRKELEAQYQQTETEIASLVDQIEILQTRIDSLEVRAPISGIVTTFQIEQLLLNRPVRRGEVLLELEHDEGEWRLELEVEEKRMGHFFDAQVAAIQTLKDDGETDPKVLEEAAKLPIEFVLATDAESTLKGRVEQVDYRIQTSEESGSIMILYASFTMDDLPRKPRIGAEVRAKINCGEKSLGYCLFGDVVEFVQKYFWL